MGVGGPQGSVGFTLMMCGCVTVGRWTLCVGADILTSFLHFKFSFGVFLEVVLRVVLVMSHSAFCAVQDFQMFYRYSGSLCSWGSFCSRDERISWGPGRGRSVWSRVCVAVWTFFQS